MNTSALIALVNQQLAENGTSFEPSNEMSIGPLGTCVFGSIKGFPCRLDFIINPANDRRSVLLFDLRTKDTFAERVAKPTFEEAIADYPWSAIIAGLTLL